MTNKEWMATLTAEQFYDEMMWLIRDFGFQFNNTRLGIIDWLDQPYRPEAKQMVFNDQRDYSPDEMSEDWRTKVITDFCRDHNVTITIDDEWKTKEKRVILRKGNYAAVRRICYDSIPTILPTILLNEMLQEILAKEDEI